MASAADMSASITTLSEARNLMYVFEVSLEIKEDEGKVGYCGKFKLNIDGLFAGYFLNCSKGSQWFQVAREFGEAVVFEYQTSFR